MEINLWPRDFTNLRPARRAHAAIILVVDIDKGGVFAQAKGTLDLLPNEDKSRVLGIVVNRFRGDLSLFDDGVPMLEQLCEVPVLAVVPYLDHGLDEEDRPLRIAIDARPEPNRLHVGAVLYPRVSNTEDLAPLLAEPDVQLTWITDARLVANQDLLVLPGSKATLSDLVQITASGMAEALIDANRQGAWVLGLCGGYQMLGRQLLDVAGTEGGPNQWSGLNLLPDIDGVRSAQSPRAALVHECLAKARTAAVRIRNPSWPIRVGRARRRTTRGGCRCRSGLATRSGGRSVCSRPTGIGRLAIGIAQCGPA